jgi:NAD(P)-dependent dehydrogenase (short-subunit alcohol dehydrogenase family)
MSIEIDLAGRTAVVTGSGQGIGLAIAEGLARAGAAVVVNARSEKSVDGAVEHVNTSVPDASVRGIAADLSTTDGAQLLLDAVPDVDILVNNVGVFEPKPFDEIPDADWMRFFETNVLSGVRLSRRWVPGMRERGWGRVVFVSSESALQIPAEMIHYGMTKTAQLAVARGLAETLAGTGVTVNSVLPGPTASEGVGTFVQQMADARGVDFAAMERDFFEHARPSSLIRRFATSDEIASMIAYVCSARASATTGAALRVDGGVVRAIA